MKDDKERFLDILEAIERIERYSKKGRKEFGKSELLQTWIVHHLQIIGEASRKLSNAARKTYPEIPWAQIIAMRNILVHDYFGVDTEEVWAAVKKDIPRLKGALKSILKKTG